jgi:hypothetical protein
MPRCAMQCIFSSNAARVRNQLFCRGDFTVVHSRCRKFLKHVHNLFTCRLWLLSPAGLRLEIGGESDKKKMNFIFNYHKKNFLTEKRSTRVDVKTETADRKVSREPKRDCSESPRRTDLGADWFRMEVDRIGLCAEFPGSASRGQRLSKL